MAEAFIKLYKKLLKWEWYDDVNTKVLFIHCLLKANWEQNKWHGVDLQPGQFITSTAKLANETNLTVKQVRVALKHLIETGEVASKGQAKYTVITINNWDVYQGKGQAKGNERANKGQAEGKQRATDKEYKEVKNKKIHNFSERLIDYEELEKHSKSDQG